MLIGRLVADPELCLTPTGEVVARFALAAGDGLDAPWEVAAWSRAGRRLAEAAAEHLRAGRLVYVEGRPADPTDAATPLVASDIQVLTRAPRRRPPRGRSKRSPGGYGRHLRRGVRGRALEVGTEAVEIWVGGNVERIPYADVRGARRAPA